MLNRTISVAKSVPRILDEMLSGKQVELVKDQVSISWPSVNKLIRLSQDKIEFNPPAKLWLEWMGITLKTELHHLTVSNNGRTVVVSITGPDITLELDTDNDGATPGSVNTVRTEALQTEEETS